MLPSKPSKKSGPSQLRSSLENRLAAYVTASSAAGVAALALAPSAHAEIVYTPANITVAGSYALDLNHDGIPDFTLRECVCESGSHTLFLSLLLDVPGNGVRNDGGPLPLGSHIAPTQSFNAVGNQYGGFPLVRIFSYGGITYRGGAWYHVHGKFLGLRFLIDGQYHYGWVRLSVPFSVDGIILGYAYETEPNKAIGAGQKYETENSTLSPLGLPKSSPSLGLLALGKDGLTLWRREEYESLQ